MPIRTFGTMAVDWEERVHFDRLREERLARIKAELQKSEIGALLCFDMSNIRYITNTTIGTWAIDKLGRFCLLLFPTLEGVVSWLRLYSAEASLDELLSGFEITRVCTPLHSKEMVVRVPAVSSSPASVMAT